MLLIYQAAGVQMQSNQFFKNADSPLPPYTISLAGYLKANTSVNDVVMTSKELGFMLNSISGRKLLTNRWAHQTDQYMDPSQRDVDAAVILYGNDNAKRMALLKKYNVKYLYWDENWIWTDYQQEQGTIYPFDPLIALDTPAARSQLGAAGVKYVNMTANLDPSIKDWNVRQYKMLYIAPANYRSFEAPWNAGLDPYLQEVWSYSDGGKKVAVLYKIKYQ
jgi:hypothetical protein